MLFPGIFAENTNPSGISMAAAVAALSTPLLWNALTLCSSMLPSLPTALAAAALWNLQQAYAQAPTAGFNAAEISLYTFEEVITIVKKLEALGLEAYTEDDLTGAESCFESALQLLEKTSSPSRLPRKVKLLTNLGITYRMQKLYGIGCHKYPCPDSRHHHN